MKTFFKQLFVIVFLISSFAGAGESLQGSKKQARKVVIVGASSGIGAALAHEYAKHGYGVCLVARRGQLLRSMKQDLIKEFHGEVYVSEIDIAQCAPARRSFLNLLEEMGDVDLVILNAGVGEQDPFFDWDKQKPMLGVNINGFTAIADLAIDYFKREGKGHLVGVSSVLGVRRMPNGTVYSATKSYQQKFLEGARATLAIAGYADIYVTDIRPGYVDTHMIKTRDNIFWMLTPAQAAEQIYAAVEARKKVAYICKRWWFIAQSLKLLPDWVFSYFL